MQRRVNGSWLTVADDNDWATQYHWKRIDGFWGTSHATLRWSIPADAPVGEYRLVHFGDSKSPWTGRITGFAGASRVFRVQ